MNKVIVIAEVGINHNGDMKNVRDLIKGAKEAGADLVKFQKRDINSVYTKEELDKYRESPWGTTNREQKEGLELTDYQYDQIDKMCKEIGIEWFASPWDMKSIEFLGKYDCKYSKIASARAGHMDMVRAIAKQKRYTFISTGMSSVSDICKIIEIMLQEDCPFELMHCTSIYPAEPTDLNLNRIQFLRKTFNCKVGYSGHEVGLIPSVASVALGATSIERHITLNRSMYGSDQSASVEIQGFKRLVDYIREVEQSMGVGERTLSKKEEEVKAKLYRTEDIK